MSPLVPEFSQKSGRDAFVNNHQMPPFEKKDWKNDMISKGVLLCAKKTHTSALKYIHFF